MRIDLHLHTTCSDGVYSPDEVIDFALGKDLEVISFTDHDTDSAYRSFDKSKLDNGLKVIHGVEITANYLGNEVHILGYFRNGSSDKLKDYLQNLQKERIARINEGISNLEKQSIRVSYDDIGKFSKGESVGRNHLASLLVENGYASNIRESFALYLKRDLNIVPQMQTPVKEVIETIKENEGVPIWAHPPQKLFDEYLPVFREYGLLGIEAYNFRKTGKTSSYYTDTARKLNLFVTAGSDWHGFEDETFPEKFYYKEALTDKFVSYILGDGA